MSPKQQSAYWKIWASVCREQGWKSSDSARRYEFHKFAELPHSTKDWNTTTHFDKYLETAAQFQNKVDIRDRAREREEHVIHRLEEAIALLTGKPYGAYGRSILVLMHDRSTAVDLPLDPIEDQRREDRPARVEVTEEGVRPVYRGDLQNHKRSLKNRLQRMLTRIREGKLECPVGFKWWFQFSNRQILESITHGQVPKPKAKPAAVEAEPVTADCPF